MNRRKFLEIGTGTAGLLGLPFVLGSAAEHEGYETPLTFRIVNDIQNAEQIQFAVRSNQDDLTPRIKHLYTLESGESVIQTNNVYHQDESDEKILYTYQHDINEQTFESFTVTHREPMFVEFTISDYQWKTYDEESDFYDAINM